MDHFFNRDKLYTEFEASFILQTFIEFYFAWTKFIVEIDSKIFDINNDLDTNPEDFDFKDPFIIVAIYYL